MNRLFNIDSPIMVFLTNLADVIILNLIALICCLPIVTIGPVITAMHYTTIKMVKNENGYLVRTFFKALKNNFKQSFLIWIVFLIITVICILDLRILQIAGMSENKVLSIIIMAIYLFMCLTVMYIFPLISYFENTIGQTVRNAIFMCILHFVKTTVMAVIYVLPFVLIPVHMNMVPIFLMVGLSGPAYINSFIWKSIFKKYEPEEEVAEEENGIEEFDISAE